MGFSERTDIQTLLVFVPNFFCVLFLLGGGGGQKKRMVVAVLLFCREAKNYSLDRLLVSMLNYALF